MKPLGLFADSGKIVKHCQKDQVGNAHQIQDIPGRRISVFMEHDQREYGKSGGGDETGGGDGTGSGTEATTNPEGETASGTSSSSSFDMSGIIAEIMAAKQQWNAQKGKLQMLNQGLAQGATGLTQAADGLAQMAIGISSGVEQNHLFS